MLCHGERGGGIEMFIVVDYCGCWGLLMLVSGESVCHRRMRSYNQVVIGEQRERVSDEWVIETLDTEPTVSELVFIDSSSCGFSRKLIVKLSSFQGFCMRRQGSVELQFVVNSSPFAQVFMSEVEASSGSTSCVQGSWYNHEPHDLGWRWRSGSITMV
ncbi:hypothetical protein Tco_1219555 [Tanacetum coccineum]